MNNKVSAREYWLDRIDKECDVKITKLRAKAGDAVSREALETAALKTLGISHLVRRKRTAKKREDDAVKKSQEARLTVENIENDIAKHLGIEGHCWERQEKVKRRMDEAMAEALAQATPDLAKAQERKQRLRDKVMSARRPKDYDEIEAALSA